MQCVACEGKGTASNGNQCVPCEGKGDYQIQLTPFASALGDRESQMVQANESLAMLDQLQVTNEQDYEQIGAWLRQCKTIKDEYETKRKSITKPLNTAKREVDSWFKPIVQTWERAEKILKAKLLTYQAEQQHKRQELAASMQQHHQQGDVATVMQLAGQAQQTQPPKLEGIQLRQQLKWRITDFDAIPRAYLAVNNQAVKLAASTGTSIPGIEFYYEAGIAASKA